MTDHAPTRGQWRCLLDPCPTAGQWQPVAEGHTPGVTYGQHLRDQHQTPGHERLRAQKLEARYWLTDAGQAALEASP